MAKKKKFKGNNAQLVGDGRLTRREMKKMHAAYHNVMRDNRSLLLDHAKSQIAAGATDLGGVANLGDLDG